MVLKPVDGDHEYVEAPLAVSDTELPVQIVADAGAIVTIGTGLTVIVTVAVFVQPLVAVPVTV